jgi:hypothetical protein
LGEKAAAALQRVERAGLDDAAIAKHQDAAGVADGGEPVRDRQGIPRKIFDTLSV